MHKKFGLVLALSCSAHAYAQGGQAIPEPMELDALLASVGWDFATAEISTQKITDDLYVLFGLGGNIGVSVGTDGVLIVDDQFPQLIPKIKSAISAVGGDTIDFAINTHWHFDHAEGNLALGSEGTWLIAQEHSREMMKSDHIINLVTAAYEQRAYPESAWPDITYTDAMEFHLNGQTISLMHFGPAHTTGDTAVYFEGTNAVHLGDVYNNSGYPFIDVDNGGSLDGVINFCSETLKHLNENTVVIPGHGPVADYHALVTYIDMLTTIRDRMVKLIKAGATLEEVYAAKPTAEYDAGQGDSTGFINRAYVSLTRKVVN
jgi:cyclase